MPLLNRGLGFVALLDDAGKATGGYALAWSAPRASSFPASNRVPLRPATLALFFFMMALIDKAALIPVGAMVERWRWKNFCLYGLWVVLPLDAGRELGLGRRLAGPHRNQLAMGHGVIDFSGAGVIHALGGLIALVGAWLLGPRMGKYRAGRPQPLPGHHVPMVILGSLIVAFGWFALNAGCALSGTDFSLSGVVVNTTLAAVAGTLGRDVRAGVEENEARPDLDLQRHDRRTGRHQRPLPVCR